MPLSPEQERALGYIRRRGAEAPLAEIKARVERTCAPLEQVVEDVSPEVARRRPAESAWSVQDIVDHLIASERPAVEQLSRLLAGHSSDTPIPAGLQSPHPLSVDWGTLLADFRSVHRQILAVLESASDDTPRTATFAVEMVVKCSTPDSPAEPVHWVQRLDWKAYAILLHMHNREHLAQVWRTLSTFLGS